MTGSVAAAILTTGYALLAGLAAALWVRSPAHQVGRVVATGELRARLGALRRLLQGRTDGPSLRRRVVVVGAGGAALVALAISWEVRPVWPASAAAAVLAPAGIVALGRLEPVAARRRRCRLVADMPQALELLAAALDAGLPLRRATAAVTEVADGPVAEDLGRVLTAATLGMFEAQAWRELATDPVWRRTAVDVARSVESGTMMVETLRQHAREARAARRAQIEVAAKAVGVRTVLPLMLCFMPAFMLIGIVPTVASALLAALF